LMQHACATPQDCIKPTMEQEGSKHMVTALYCTLCTHYQGCSAAEQRAEERLRLSVGANVLSMCDSLLARHSEGLQSSDIVCSNPNQSQAKRHEATSKPVKRYTISSSHDHHVSDSRPNVQTHSSHAQQMISMVRPAPAIALHTSHKHINSDVRYTCINSTNTSTAMSSTHALVVQTHQQQCQAHMH
jgi:hypothetical protein